MVKENAYTRIDMRKWWWGGILPKFCLERPASMLLNDLDVWVYKELLPFVEYLFCDNALII